MRAFIIAIDGPSGAGKGTVARALARELGYRHVDTGAMYRAVAWKARQQRLDLRDEAPIARIAATSELDLSGDAVVLDGEDVTRAIRTPEIDRAAAAVARLPAVRSALVERQRAFRAGGGLVMEGRDIGTAVFPDADVKIYLDASPHERARRRATDQAHASHDTGMDLVATALRARDESDRTRTASPLTVAADATVLDTTGLPVDAVVGLALELVKAALRRAEAREAGA
jgi:CMP/dCMP kinase